MFCRTTFQTKGCLSDKIITDKNERQQRRRVFRMYYCCGNAFGGVFPSIQEENVKRLVPGMSKCSLRVSMTTKKYFRCYNEQLND